MPSTRWHTSPRACEDTTELQLQLHSHDSPGVRWPLQKDRLALRFVRAVGVEHCWSGTRVTGDPRELGSRT